MQAAYDLAALRQAVTLLEGELMLEGWAAERETGGGRVLGLLVVTSWRVIFADMEGAFTAFPIFKIHEVQSDSPSQVTLSVWYDRMQLRFDNQAAAYAVLNLLRQDPCWNAGEVKVAFGEDRSARREHRTPSNAALYTAVLVKVS